VKLVEETRFRFEKLDLKSNRSNSYKKKKKKPQLMWFYLIFIYCPHHQVLSPATWHTGQPWLQQLQVPTPVVP
jgi:hypothetical protein